MLLYFALGWILGIFTADIAHQPLWAWCLIAIIGASLAFHMRQDWLMRNVMLAVLAFGLGAARHTFSQPNFSNPQTLAYHNAAADDPTLTPTPLTLEGTIIAEPDLRTTYQSVRVAVNVVLLNGDLQPITAGIMTASLPLEHDLSLGTQVRLSGNLVTPQQFPGFDYNAYLARQGVHSQLRKASVTRLGIIDTWADCRVHWSVAKCGQHMLQLRLVQQRQRLSATIDAIFPPEQETETAYLKAILLGERTALSKQISNDFRRAGASHLLAISGFHIAIVGGALLWLFDRFRLGRRGRWLTVLALWGFILLIGAPPSALRAGLMASAVLITGILDRPASGLPPLALAVLVMTTWNPNYLWWVGFQLSVLATLSLILFAGRMQAAVQNLPRWLKPIALIMLLTVAVQITTLPLVAYTFRQLSLVSLLTNILLTWAQPFALLLGGIATLIGTLHVAAGSLLSWLAWPWLRYSTWIVTTLAALPNASVHLTTWASSWLLSYYGVLLIILWQQSLLPEQRFAWIRWLGRHVWALIAIGVLLLSGFVVWQASGAELETKTVTLYTADIKATLAVSAAGDNTILIQLDESPYAGQDALEDQLAAHLPLFDQTLDAVVLLAPDFAVAGQAERLIAAYPVTEVHTVFDVNMLSDWDQATMGQLAAYGFALRMLVIGDAVTDSQRLVRAVDGVWGVVETKN